MISLKADNDALASPRLDPVQNSHRAQPADSLADLAKVIEMVGHEGFLNSLTALCQSVSGYDSSFVAAFFPSHPPVELFDNLDDKYCDATIKPYLDFAYLLDPFYNLLLREFGDGVVAMADCAPDDFLTSDYYRTFYSGTGLYDETGIFIRFDQNASLVLSLGSREPGFQLSPRARTDLEGLLPCIVALCHRHWPRLDPESVVGHGRMGQHLDKSFERFATSALSEREAEIVRLILKGHSSKSIARELGNSPETVKVHRKHIHAKLGITSQGELFSLFLDALSSTPSNATEDPLIYLDRKADDPFEA